MSDNTDAIFQEIMAQATGKMKHDRPETAQLKQMQMIISAMDEGLVRTAQAVGKIGQSLDLLNIKMNMIIQVLIDKDIVTLEELNGPYRDMMQQMLNNIKAQQEAVMKQQMESIEEEAGIKTREGCECECETPCESCPEEIKEEEKEKVSDVVLASERGGVTKF